MVSLTLTPFAPWHAAQTVAALALPASISAACANGATARARDNPRIFFMGLLLCTRTQGYTPNPPRTMPPSATTRQAWSIFSFPVRHATLTARVQRREAPMTILRTLAPFLAAAIAFAADIFGYGEGVLPKDVPEMQAQIAIYDKDRSLMRARTQAAFDVLVKNPMVDPSRIALIGYCFGGGVGIEFASTGAPLVANVSIHGSFRDRAPGWAANAKGMFLNLHGAEDVGFPLTTVNRLVEELRSAKVPFQYEVYSGTGHGFSTPKNKAEERANAQSIGTTTRTLKELFGI